ncbi:MAG TPA: cupin domain-containing protein [Gaiellales bacterium]|nr:cupin domain-containing protein [Gaiellales bacterium]
MAEDIQVGPLAIRFLIDAEASSGSATVFEFTVPAGSRVPVPHSHDAYEETIYGLDGELTWTVDDEEIGVAPGQAICIPRGVVHGFENRGTVDARALAVVTPGVLGPEYFRDLRAVVEAAAGPPDPAAIAEVMQRHGLTPAP